MKFAETASPDISGVGGPHHVAKNFGNTFWHKFRQHFQKLDFFHRKKAKIGIFDLSFWQGRGCAWSKIFFWCDAHWLGVKPHGRPKSRTRPPRGVTNLLKSPSMDFGWHLMMKAFWPNFEMPYLREYIIEIHKTASPDILGVGGPHCVAKNFDNNFCHKFRQQLLS